MTTKCSTCSKLKLVLEKTKNAVKDIIGSTDKNWNMDSK